MIIKTPGIYEMSNKDYHSAQAHSPITDKLERVMSKSGLTTGARSWAHFKAACDFPMVPTPAMEFGTDAHTATLEFLRWQAEKKEWLETHVIKPTFTGKGSKEQRTIWEVENAGKTWISKIQYQSKIDHFHKIDRIREETFKHPEAAPLLKGGKAEMSVFWFDEELQVWLKARPDYVTENGVYVEFKTTTDARASAFVHVCNRFKYHWHSLYLDGLTAVAGFPHTEMVIIAVEATEPHAVNVFPIDRATIEIGRMQYRSCLAKFAECLRTDTWPAYSLNNPPLRFSRAALTVPDDVWDEY